MINNDTLAEERTAVGQFKILVIGDTEDVAGAIASLKTRNTNVATDYLRLQEDNSDSAERQPDGPHRIYRGYSEEFIANYDLILMHAPHNAQVKEIIAFAARRGVLVSALEAEASGSKKLSKAMQGERYWNRFAFWCLFSLAAVIVVQVVITYFPLQDLIGNVQQLARDLHLDARFGYMLLAGFLAQMVDGALGMGYGVISTTILLSTGLNPAAISGSIHTAEMFSSGASGFSHYRFGNINKKLFKTIVFPGVAGAIIGALLLCYLGEAYGDWMRPVLSVYTLLLGARILRNAFVKRNESRKVKNAGWLAGAGGFLDSFGGGGWGPLVTSTLISKGKTPRYIIGTVSLTEFFVTLGSALTFFLVLGTSHIETIAGLIIGGLLAAPIAARLAGNLKTKTILIAVGILVIISSLRTILKTLGVF